MKGDDDLMTCFLSQYLSGLSFCPFTHVYKLHSGSQPNLPGLLPFCSARLVPPPCFSSVLLSASPIQPYQLMPRLLLYACSGSHFVLACHVFCSGCFMYENLVVSEIPVMFPLNTGLMLPYDPQTLSVMSLWCPCSCDPKYLLHKG